MNTQTQINTCMNMKACMMDQNHKQNNVIFCPNKEIELMAQLHIDGKSMKSNRRATRCILLVRDELYILIIIIGMQKYEIMNVIDEGAYGIVWKAFNKDSKELVAIKEFKESDDDPSTRYAIQREIKMLKMLKGEYVVGIKEAFKKKGKIYLIFQYCAQNLLNLIEKYEKGLQPPLINNIVYKIIRCLKFLHQKNILHRDIKPQNLLLNADYSDLKLCDFGFARFAPENNRELTEYVATRWYRSPELLVGEPYGKPADIWALGCIIGELVDGQPMFPGQNQMDQLFLIKKGVGNFTPLQSSLLSTNPKFLGVEFPQLRKIESIDTRYLGKIQKNALKFMKLCLTMDPSERITVDEALKHPFLYEKSLLDNYFEDQQDLLESSRNMKKQSLFINNKKPLATKNYIQLSTIQQERNKKDSVISLRKEQGSYPYQIDPALSAEKEIVNINKMMNKSTLKMQGSSMPEPKQLNSIQNQFLGSKYKKGSSEVALKSHEQLIAKKYSSELSPKLKIKKDTTRKIMKMMSQEKHLNVNLQVNLNINLKYYKKSGYSVQKTKATKISQYAPQKGHKIGIPSKLPEIKNSTKGIKYGASVLNMRYERTQGRNLSIMGESKTLVKAKYI